jgi:hypothetical protein
MTVGRSFLFSVEGVAGVPCVAFMNPSQCARRATPVTQQSREPGHSGGCEATRARDSGLSHIRPGGAAS